MQANGSSELSGDGSSLFLHFQLTAQLHLCPFLQHATSVSIMGFSNTVEMELSSTRLARTIEPQIHRVSSLTAAPTHTIPSLLSGPPQTVPSLMSVSNHAMPSLTASHLQPVPNLARGTFQSTPNLRGDSSQAITSLASNHSQAGPSLMSGHTQAAPSLATCPLQGMPPVSDVHVETRSVSSPGSGPAAESLGTRDGAESSLGNALCKVGLRHSTFAYYEAKGWPLTASHLSLNLPVLVMATMSGLILLDVLPLTDGK